MNVRRLIILIPFVAGFLSSCRGFGQAVLQTCEEKDFFQEISSEKNNSSFFENSFEGTIKSIRTYYDDAFTRFDVVDVIEMSSKAKFFKLQRKKRTTAADINNYFFTNELYHEDYYIFEKDSKLCESDNLKYYQQKENPNISENGILQWQYIDESYVSTIMNDALTYNKKETSSFPVTSFFEEGLGFFVNQILENIAWNISLGEQPNQQLITKKTKFEKSNGEAGCTDDRSFNEFYGEGASQSDYRTFTNSILFNITGKNGLSEISNISKKIIGKAEGSEIETITFTKLKIEKKHITISFPTLD